MSRRPVAVTGMGCVCAAGMGVDALQRALWSNRVCSVPGDSALPVRAVASVPGDVPELEGFLDDRKAALAMLAFTEAASRAGGTLAGPRTGVFLGTGLSSITPRELAEDVYPHLRDGAFDRAAMAADLEAVGGAPWRHMPARVTQAIANVAGATGAQGTNFSACAAAAQAIAAGTRAIQRGQIDRAIVGGHDSMIHPMGILSFVVLGALSPVACRPFDRDRDGFLIGEGAAILILEAESVARARGAHVHARVLGTGTSVDAWNVTAPHPAGAGAEQSMRRALRDAGLPPSAIDYINAHGTGTPVGDVAEAQAIHRTFGEDVPVSSIKGAIGHTIAAAGAVEAVATICALEQGMLPGTAGLLRQDPACPVQVLSSPQRASPTVGLSNSFGFGGQNCSLLFGSVPT